MFISLRKIGPDLGLTQPKYILVLAKDQWTYISRLYQLGSLQSEQVLQSKDWQTQKKIY